MTETFTYNSIQKSWLVVKVEKEEEAKQIFAGTGIQITTEGRKYLGGYVGTREGAVKYVNSLQNEWIEQLQVSGLLNVRALLNVCPKF